jgi:hypothetical protein
MLRFSFGAVFGFSAAALTHHSHEQLVWIGAGLALLLGMFTADVGNSGGKP